MTGDKTAEIADQIAHITTDTMLTTAEVEEVQIAQEVVQGHPEDSDLGQGHLGVALLGTDQGHRENQGHLGDLGHQENLGHQGRGSHHDPGQGQEEGHCPRESLGLQGGGQGRLKRKMTVGDQPPLLTTIRIIGRQTQLSAVLLLLLLHLPTHRASQDVVIMMVSFLLFDCYMLEVVMLIVMYKF